MHRVVNLTADEGYYPQYIAIHEKAIAYEVRQEDNWTQDHNTEVIGHHDTDNTLNHIPYHSFPGSYTHILILRTGSISWVRFNGMLQYFK